MIPRYFVFWVGSTVMLGNISGGLGFLTPWWEKSISASLLYLMDELWDIDHSIILPILVIISARMQ
jgi:hypothetical protein